MVEAITPATSGLSFPGTFRACPPSYYLLKASNVLMSKRLSQSPESFLPLTPVAFEILLALAEGERHGYEVMIDIERRSAGRISPNPGTLYRALDRLVQEGLLTSGVRSVEGDSRRVFSLSLLGRSVAAAEAARLSDQVLAARSLRLFKRSGA
jgi:DNA-binding PadR family transcriptional regulator